MRQVIPGLSNDRRQYEFCGKLNACGHTCLGVRGETECIPCMDPGCKEPAEVIQPQDMIDMPEPELSKKRSLINGTQTDMCGICHINELGSKACVGLACRHVFHAECIDGRIRQRQSRRITMAHLHCPVCKNEFELCPEQSSKELRDLLAAKKAEREQIRQAAIQIYNVDGLAQGLTEEQKASPFKFMMDHMTLYNCFKCQKVYNGGKNDFDGAVRENMDPKNFLC